MSTNLKDIITYNYKFHSFRKLQLHHQIFPQTTSKKEINKAHTTLFIRWPSQANASMNTFIPLLVSMYEFLIQKKVIILHSIVVLQQPLEMNGRKLQRYFIYTVINIFWSTICTIFYLLCVIYKIHTKVLSASWHFNYSHTLIYVQFIFLPQIFHQSIFCIKSCVHCAHLTDFIYILEIVNQWLEREGQTNADYCSIYSWWCNRAASVNTEMANFELSSR